MFNTNVHLLFLIIIPGECSWIFDRLSDTQIKDFSYSPCSYNAISVKDFNVRIGTNKHFEVSGTASIKQDIVSPISAKVTLKRKIWFTWITVPCGLLGSCSFSDLCSSYGYSKTEQCPPELVQYNIPCRCPIRIGNYRIPLGKVKFDDADVVTGEYKGEVVINDSYKQMACYEFSFTLEAR